MVTITVKYFAGLREALGASSEEMKFTEAPTVSEVVDQVFGAHPEQAAYRPSLMLAVNMAYAQADTMLTDGDELALIPPVSGGSR